MFNNLRKQLLYKLRWHVWPSISILFTKLQAIDLQFLYEGCFLYLKKNKNTWGTRSIISFLRITKSEEMNRIVHQKPKFLSYYYQSKEISLRKLEQHCMLQRSSIWIEYIKSIMHNAKKKICRNLLWLNHLENVLGGNLEFPFSPVGKLSDFPRSRLGETSRFLDLSLCWLLSDDFPLDSWWLWWRRSDSPPCSRFWTAFRPLSKFWSSVAIWERRSFKKLSLFVSFDRALVELEPYIT